MRYRPIVVYNADDLNPSGALQKQRALKLLELYRSAPAETQGWPHIAVLMARLEVAGGDQSADVDAGRASRTVPDPPLTAMRVTGRVRRQARRASARAVTWAR